MPHRGRLLRIGWFSLALVGLGAWYAWWRTESWPARVEFNPPESSSFSGFTPDGRFFETERAGQTALWDAASGRLARRYPTPAILSRLLSADRQRIIGLLQGGTGLTEIVIGTAAAGVIEHRLPVQPAMVRQFAWLEGDRSAQALIEDPARNWEVITWDMATAAVSRRPIRGPGVSFGRPAAFSPDGRVLAYVDLVTAALQFWDIARDRPIGGLLVNPRAQPRVGGRNWACATFTPDGQTLVLSRNDHQAEFWDLPSLQLQRVISLHRPGLSILYHQIAPDGRTLVSIAVPHSAPSGLDQFFASLRSLFLSSNRSRPDQELVVLDLSTDGILARSRRLTFAGFSPDGATIATCDPDGTIGLRALPRSGR